VLVIVLSHDLNISLRRSRTIRFKKNIVLVMKSSQPSAYAQDAGMPQTWQSVQRTLANLRLTGKNTVFPYSCFGRTLRPVPWNPPREVAYFPRDKIECAAFE
jgi:hypothetical protein